uniref:Uncharacterized protein n=1 Tax=Rhizophora mucronata TaxID=61149 RepID=A0A2P2KID0_RHIMU
MSCFDTVHKSRVIVIGYHPVVVCEEDKEQIEAKQVHESLHHTFVKYRVVRSEDIQYVICGIILPC